MNYLLDFLGVIVSIIFAILVENGEIGQLLSSIQGVPGVSLQFLIFFLVPAICALINPRHTMQKAFIFSIAYFLTTVVLWEINKTNIFIFPPVAYFCVLTIFFILGTYLGSGVRELFDKLLTKK